MKKNSLALSLFTAIFLVGCGGGGGGGSSSSTSGSSETTSPIVITTDVTVERGALLNAAVTDANGQGATQKSGSNVYTFATTPIYPITATGGYIDVDGDGAITTADIAFTGVLKSYSTVITPITTYIATGTTETERTAKLIELKAKLTGTISDDDLLKKVPSVTTADIVVLTNAIYDSYSVLFDNDTTNDDVSSLATRLSDKITLYKNVVTQSGTGKSVKELARLVEEELILIKGISKLTSDDINKINHPISPVEADKITFKGLEYGIITSPITGKKWLDRNLGATEVCSKSRDDYSLVNDETSNNAYFLSQYKCFGDYYQWGRLADGHQSVNSLRISTISTNISPNHSNFITTYSLPFDWVTGDYYGETRKNRWSKVDGTGICPTGFRVPTEIELSSETVGYSGIDNILTGAVKVISRGTGYQNFLKIPMAGYARNIDGAIDSSSSGELWTNTAVGSNSKYLSVNRERFDEGRRSISMPVRCIKD